MSGIKFLFPTFGSIGIVTSPFIRQRSFRFDASYSPTNFVHPNFGHSFPLAALFLIASFASSSLPWPTFNNATEEFIAFRLGRGPNCGCRNFDGHFVGHLHIFAAFSASTGAKGTARSMGGGIGKEDRNRAQFGAVENNSSRTEPNFMILVLN
jgi:hypothetical protein